MDSAMIAGLDARYLASVMKVRFFPLTIASADGCRITDTEGVTRLDFTAGWAVANLGYNNPRVRNAVAISTKRSGMACTDLTRTTAWPSWCRWPPAGGA